LARRNLLGLIALVLLGLAAVFCFYRPLAGYQTAGGLLLRVGMVMSVLWLAWPDLNRMPGWFWFALPIGLLAVLYLKGILVYILPALAGLLLVYLFYRKLRRPR
jgi:hypothetical protein